MIFYFTFTISDKRNSATCAHIFCLSSRLSTVRNVTREYIIAAIRIFSPSRVGQSIWLLCWSIIQKVVNHLKTDAGSHVKLYLRRCILALELYKPATRKTCKRPEISGRFEFLVAPLISDENSVPYIQNLVNNTWNIIWRDVIV